MTHSLSSAEIRIFSMKIRIFCCIRKYRSWFHFNTCFLIRLIFFEFLKVVIINMLTILMRSAKLTTLGFLKIKVFWNKGYDDIIFVHDVISKIFSLDSIYILDSVMWSKFGNSSISIRKIIILSYHIDKKNHFERCSCFKLNNLRLKLVMPLKFYTIVEKGLN